MNQKRRKVTAMLAVALFVLLLAPPFSIFVTSWYSRWEASRLLACAKTIQPGTTTEAETRKALSGFDKYLSHGQERIVGHPTATRDIYSISNYPHWIRQIAPRLPIWANERIWFLPYSSFSVSPRFQNGELVLLEVREIQEHKGDIHPFAAIVRVLSTKSEQGAPELPDAFSGFHVNPIEEGAYDESGKQLGSWVIREFVTLDERASPDQLARSFDFHLSCLTSPLGCHDARKILSINE
jgi:hypothetical protein